MYHTNLLTVKRHDINFNPNDCCHHPFFMSPSSTPPSSRSYTWHNVQTQGFIFVSRLVLKSKCTTDAQSHTTNIHIHPRPPSCQRAKPSACLTLPLRMFLTSAVMWFSQWWGFVCVCVLFVPWWRERGGAFDWAVTNPLTTRLNVIGHDHTKRGCGQQVVGRMIEWLQRCSNALVESKRSKEGKVSYRKA